MEVYISRILNLGTRMRCAVTFMLSRFNAGMYRIGDCALQSRSARHSEEKTLTVLEIEPRVLNPYPVSVPLMVGRRFGADSFYGAKS
jgi:hypothetical protein